MMPVLKLGFCPPTDKPASQGPIAGEVFTARFNDPKAIANIFHEPMRVVVAVMVRMESR